MIISDAILAGVIDLIRRVSATRNESNTPPSAVTSGGATPQATKGRFVIMAKRYDIAEVLRAGEGKSPEEKYKAYRPLLLQRSLDEFREAHLRRAETGERAAYVEAIRALTGVLLHLEEPLAMSDAEPAYMWFFDLTRNLEDLDSGVVPPMLDCDERKKGLSTVEWMQRVWVVASIEGLRATGMSLKDAAKQVIRDRELKEKVKEVLAWRAEFRKGKVPNREAKEIYSDFLGLPVSAAAIRRRRRPPTK
jgi:hypothetical protein